MKKNDKLGRGESSVASFASRECTSLPLLSLPEDLLAIIFLKAGPRGRRACRAWHAAYPPLSSLNIRGFRTPSALKSHLTIPRPHLTHLTSLQLTLPSNLHTPDYNPLLPLIATAFPLLQSLTIHPYQDQQTITLHPNSLHHLNHLPLTYLSLPISPEHPNPTNLPLFTSTIQSLSLHCTPAPHQVAACAYTHACGPVHTSYLANLSSLPNLTHLSLSSPQFAFPKIPLDADTFLPALATCAPNLLSLSLTVPTTNWTPAALSALSTTLPSLHTLSLSANAPGPQHFLPPITPQPPSNPIPPLCTALPHRTALTSLSLHFHSLTPASSLTALSTLSLSSLSLTGFCIDDNDPAALSTALHTLLPSLSQLTYLNLSLHQDNGRIIGTQSLPPPCLPTTLKDLTITTAVGNNSNALEACLSTTPHLTALRISTPAGQLRPHDATVRVEHLTRLEVLHAEGLPNMVLDILQGTSYLTRLKDLHLCAEPAYTGSHMLCRAVPSPAYHSSAAITPAILSASLAHLSGSLTRLSLSNFIALKSSALTVLRSLSQLRELELHLWDPTPCTWPQPQGLGDLPPLLHSLRVGNLGLSGELEEEVRQAARRQDCFLIITDDPSLDDLY